MTSLNGINLFFFLFFLVTSVGGNAQHFGRNAVRKFDWMVENTTITRLCQTKNIMTINGQFPGPTQYVTEGDTVSVKVTNRCNVGITIHWHGARQLLTSWADGPAYITQCPIQPGESYTHTFDVVDQRGTMLWHAHHSWQRATLYGAFIIFPKSNKPYPFMPPMEMPPLLLGEWWIADTEKVIAEALVSGGTPNNSDALTINGQPGVLYNCSKDDVAIYTVEYGRTYLFRVVNVAVHLQLYFAIENHTFTIVEADAEYTLPHETDLLVLAPGQSMNILLQAKDIPKDTDTNPRGAFLIASSAFSPVARFPATPTTAILSYASSNVSEEYESLPLPPLPASDDTNFTYNFYKNGLNSQPFSRGFYYMEVPTQIDHSFLYTVGYGTFACPENTTCVGPLDEKFAASINNISFANPTISLLEAWYNNISGVYETNFPTVPELSYNYTGGNVTTSRVQVGTKVQMLAFGDTVQVVFQNTGVLRANTHPLHLHGQSFWVVGMGLGNFNASSDPASFNLRNPILRNTAVVPIGGWVAIRFKALNPGVWLMHCHFDHHQVWGMAMAFIVQNGNGDDETLPPPPGDFPKCY